MLELRIGFGPVSVTMDDISREMLDHLFLYYLYALIFTCCFSALLFQGAL